MQFDDLLVQSWQQTFPTQCELYRHFLQVSEEFYDQAGKEEKAELDRLTDGMSREVANEVWMHEGEYYARITEEFPQITRRSNFVTIFAFWESEFRSIAEWLLATTGRRHIGSSPILSLTDLGGDIRTKCRTVLIKVVGVHDEQSLWRTLRDFAVVRHNIVHGGGHVSTEDKNGKEIPTDPKFAAVLQRLGTQGLEVGHYGTIIVNPSLNVALLSTIERYIMDVLARCEAHFSGMRSVESVK